jgi:WD40 repeat protein
MAESVSACNPRCIVLLAGIWAGLSAGAAPAKPAAPPEQTARPVSGRVEDEPGRTQGAPTQESTALPKGALARLRPADARPARAVWLLAFSPDGRTLATAGAERPIRLWSLPAGLEAGCYPTDDHDVRALRYAGDGRLLAAGFSLAKVRLWEPVSGKDVRRFTGHEAGLGAFRGQKNGVVTLALSPDGSRLAAALSDHTIRVWEPDPEKPCRVLPGRGSWAAPLAFSPDGSLLAAAYPDDRLRLWEVASGREVRAIPTPQSPRAALAFAPDGAEVAAGMYGSVGIWDVATGREVRRLRGHEGAVLAVAYSADGRLLATGCEDGALRL